MGAAAAAAASSSSSSSFFLLGSVLWSELLPTNVKGGCDGGDVDYFLYLGPVKFKDFINTASPAREMGSSLQAAIKHQDRKSINSFE